MKSHGKNCRRFFAKMPLFCCFFSYVLSIESPLSGYVEVYISVLSADSDYKTRENVYEGIYDAVLNLK